MLINVDQHLFTIFQHFLKLFQQFFCGSLFSESQLLRLASPWWPVARTAASEPAEAGKGQSWLH